MLVKKKNQFTWSLFVSGLVLKLECCFKAHICMFWSKCDEPVTVWMTSLSEFCLLSQGLCCLDCSAPLCRLARPMDMRISSHTHTHTHTHVTFSKYSQHILDILSFSTFPSYPPPIPTPPPAPTSLPCPPSCACCCFTFITTDSVFVFAFCFHLVTIWTGCWNRLQYLYQHLLLNITSLGWQLVVIFILTCTVYGWFLALFSRACWQSVLVAMMCWCLATPFLQAPRPLCSASWFAWTRAPCHCVSWCTCVYIVYQCFQSFYLRRVEREWNWMNTGKRRTHLIVNVK